MSDWYDLDHNLISVEEANKLFVDDEKRRIAETKIGDIWISTVFLSLDHNHFGSGPPILYETMIFGGKHDEYQERYCTREAALAGHDQAVAMVKESLHEDS